VFTEAVLSEAMRLYPPIFGIGRETLTEVELAGRVFAPGTNVYILPWVIQRDPRFFTEPDELRPERWLDGLAKRLPRFAYFPFGGGPRLCMGQQFAMLEAIIVLSRVAQHWQLNLVPGQHVVPDPALTLRPRAGLQVQLERR